MATIGLRTIASVVAAALLAIPLPTSQAATGDMAITVVDSLTGTQLSASGFAYLYRDGEVVVDGSGSYVGAPLVSGKVTFAAAKIGADRADLSVSIEFLGTDTGPVYKNLMYEPLADLAAQQVSATSWLGAIRIVDRRGGSDQASAYREVGVVERTTRDWLAYADLAMSQVNSSGRFGFDLPPGKYALSFKGIAVGFGPSAQAFPMALVPVEVAEVDGSLVMLDDQGRQITGIRLHPSTPARATITTGSEIDEGSVPAQYRGSQLVLDSEDWTLSARGQARASWESTSGTLTVQPLPGDTQTTYRVGADYSAVTLAASPTVVADDGSSVAVLLATETSARLIRWNLAACTGAELAPACEVATPAGAANLFADLELGPTEQLALALQASGSLAAIQATGVIDDEYSPRGMAVIVRDAGITSSGVIAGGGPIAQQRFACGSITGGDVSADGSTAIFTTADAGCLGRAYLWSSTAPDAYDAELAPQESGFGDSIPAYPTLSADGTTVALRVAVPGVTSASTNIVLLSTRTEAPARIAFIDRTYGNTGGLSTARPLSIDTTGGVWAWVDPSERPMPDWDLRTYGIEDTGRRLLRIVPAEYGRPTVDVITAGEGGESLPTPAITVTTTKLGASGETVIGSELRVSARSAGAQAMTGSVTCTGCAQPLALTFQAVSAGVFSATTTLPAGTARIDSISVEATAPGLRPATGQASGLPGAIASRYRVNLSGTGVGASASDQVRTARLVATRAGSATTYTSAAIGTSTTVSFDVPSTSDGARLVAANGEILGAIAIDARAGAVVSDALQVRQRVGLKVRVPQAVPVTGQEDPFSYGSLIATVTAPDGAVLGSYAVGPDGIVDFGRVPAGVDYRISVALKEWARGPGAATYTSSAPTAYTPVPGAATDIRIATVNLRPVPSGPVTFRVVTRRVIGDAEGPATALASARVVLAGRTRPDGVSISQTWQGQTDATGLVTLTGIPAGDYVATVSGGRSYGTASITIGAPGSRATVDIRAQSDDPIEVPFVMQVGTRPDEISLVRADWRALVHYSVSMSGGNQFVAAAPTDTETSGIMVVPRPGDYRLCGSGHEANIMVAPCVQFEAALDGSTRIIAADGTRAPGMPTLRIAPVAALEVTAIDGLGPDALRAASISINGGSPVALLPWRVAPTAPIAATAGSSAVPGAPGVIPLPSAGEVTVRLHSSDGRETTTTVTVGEGEVKAIRPRFAKDDDILGADSGIVLASGLVVPGVATQVRYRIRAGATALPSAVLSLEMPPGLALRDRSIIVDGVPASGSAAQIALGALRAGQERSVTVLVDSDAGVSGPQVLGASVRAGTKTAALPVAILSFGNITLDAPASTRARTVIVSGRAGPRVQVEIIDQGSGAPLAAAMTSSTGSYQVAVQLPEAAVTTAYTLIARVVDSSPVIESTARTVTLDPSGVQITSVTLRQVNPADANDTRSLTGDPRLGVMRAPFVWVPGHIPSVSFTVDDPSRVRRAVVLLGAANAVATRSGNTFTATFPSTVDAGPVDIRLDVSAPQVNTWSKANQNQIVSALPPAMKTPVIKTTVTADGTRAQLRWVSGDSSVKVFDARLRLRPAAAGAKAGVVTFPVSPFTDGRKENRSSYPQLVVNVAITGDPLATRSGPSPRAPLSTQLWTATVDLVKGDATSLGQLAVFDDYIPMDNFSGGAFAYLSLDGLAGAATSDGLSKDINAFTDEVVQYCADYPEVQLKLMQEVEQLIKLARWGTHWYGPLYSMITLPIKNPVLGVAAGAIGSVYSKEYDGALKERLDLLRPQLDFCKQLRRQQQRFDAEHDAIRRLLDGQPSGNVVAAPVYIYDPSGYVYEAVRTNRIQGAVATLFDHTDVVPGREPVKWDAIPYGQVNDLVTNAVGRYGWDVPPGLWRVMITKPGYRVAYSDVVRVLPPQLEVDIGMVSTQAPKMSSVTQSKGTVRVAFSQYMTVDSMTKAVAAAATYVVRKKGRKTTVTVPFKESAGEGGGRGLPADPTAPVAVGSARPLLSRTLVLTPQRKLPKGAVITVTFAKGAKAYTGRVLGAQPTKKLKV